MRAHKKSPTLIQVSSNGEVIGHMTCEEFRAASGSRNEFIGTLCEKFNSNKEHISEPERVKQVIQLPNGKTI